MKVIGLPIFGTKLHKFSEIYHTPQICFRKFQNEYALLFVYGVGGAVGVWGNGGIVNSLFVLTSELPKGKVVTAGMEIIMVQAIGSLYLLAAVLVSVIAVQIRIRHCVCVIVRHVKILSCILSYFPRQVHDRIYKMRSNINIIQEILFYHHIY